MLCVLEDDINDSVEEELKAVFEDLGEDQLAEVIAFCWVGQGTYEAGDWDEALEEAQTWSPKSEERSTNSWSSRCLRPSSIRDLQPSTLAVTGLEKSPNSGMDKLRSVPRDR